MFTPAPNPASDRTPAPRPLARTRPLRGGHERRGHRAPEVVRLDAQLREMRRVGPADPPQPLVAARVLRLPRGPLDPRAIADEPEGWSGLLILDGVVTVGLEAGRACSSWLFGEDDVIRPWDTPMPELVERTSWRALTDARVALLDRGFTRRASEFPAVTRELIRRAAGTTNWLLARSLVANLTVVEQRLMLLFRFLAQRWGRVRPEGIRLELPLTHELLATMCSARRPSVSVAVGSLRSRGVLEQLGRSAWLLHDDPTLSMPVPGVAPPRSGTSAPRALPCDHAA